MDWKSIEVLGNIGNPYNQEYTFNNNYPDAASRITPGTALFITTGRLPQVNLSIQNVDISSIHKSSKFML